MLIYNIVDLAAFLFCILQSDNQLATLCTSNSKCQCFPVVVKIAHGSIRPHAQLRCIKLLMEKKNFSSAGKTMALLATEVL